jgi:2-deoxy-D-gluconate 3-dehydrogenase
MFDLTGKRAVVTGGAGQIGKSLCIGLLQAGAKVAVIDNSPDTEKIVNEIGEYGEVYATVADIKKSDAREAAFKKCVETLSGLDILVNCAGIQRRYFCTEFPLEEWDDVIAINLTAAFHFSQLAGGYMMENHKTGRIINIASLNTFNGGVRIPAYVASKAGLAGVTRAMSNELAGKGITVNAIVPGYMNTTLNSLRNDPATLARIPAGRVGEPDDLVPALIFLASDETTYISGITLPVDGGFLGK